MDRKPKAKSSKKTLNAKRMKDIKGGTLGSFSTSPPAESAGSFKSVGGLKSETEVTETDDHRLRIL